MGGSGRFSNAATIGMYFGYLLKAPRGPTWACFSSPCAPHVFAEQLSMPDLVSRKLPMAFPMPNKLYSL